LTVGAVTVTRFIGSPGAGGSARAVRSRSG
jgi:hypothetical protein